MGIEEGKKVIIICDRGTMDSSACTGVNMLYLKYRAEMTIYIFDDLLDIDRKSWLTILKNLNKTEVEVRDNRYDCAVHLVTI